jgi:hypothetical protein
MQVSGSVTRSGCDDATPAVSCGTGPLVLQRHFVIMWVQGLVGGSGRLGRWLDAVVAIGTSAVVWRVRPVAGRAIAAMTSRATFAAKRPDGRGPVVPVGENLLHDRVAAVLGFGLDGLYL